MFRGVNQWSSVSLLCMRSWILSITPHQKKVKQEDITWPNNLTAEHILKRSNSPSIVIRKCFYVNINFCLLLVISQKLKAAYMSTNGIMPSQNMICPYSEILLDNRISIYLAQTPKYILLPERSQTLKFIYSICKKHPEQANLQRQKVSQ